MLPFTYCSDSPVSSLPLFYRALILPQRCKLNNKNDSELREIKAMMNHLVVDMVDVVPHGIISIYYLESLLLYLIVLNSIEKGGGRAQ
jgi:hypothetical protein